MAMTRHKMRCTLTRQYAQMSWPYRTITPKDSHMLATLMYEAYRGTIDDEGETLEDAINETQRTLSGEYGCVLDTCSFLIEDHGRALSATIITKWEGAPLLAFVMTHPDARGKGMGTFLIRQSVNALLDQGQRELYLFVTDGNAPAQHIYNELGFAVVT